MGRGHADDAASAAARSGTAASTTPARRPVRPSGSSARSATATARSRSRPLARTLAAQGRGGEALRTAEEVIATATPMGGGRTRPVRDRSGGHVHGPVGPRITHARLASRARSAPSVMTRTSPWAWAACSSVTWSRPPFAGGRRAGRDPNGTQAMALALVAAGRPAQAVERRGPSREAGSTYLDRFTAPVAPAWPTPELGSGRPARPRRRGARCRRTGDRVARALRLAHAAALTGSAPAAADAVQEEAGRRARRLELDPAAGRRRFAWLPGATSRAARCTRRPA